MGLIDARLSETDGAILTARFTAHSVPCRCSRLCCKGERPNKAWVAAVLLLVEYLPNPFPETGANFLLREAFIRKFFGEKVSIVDTAKRAHVHRDTASEHNSRVVRLLRADEQRSMYEIAAALAESGLLAEGA
jgi:hypothetical protein